LHCFLWPPSFQCVFWHSIEQYHTCARAKTAVADRQESTSTARQGARRKARSCAAIHAGRVQVHPSHTKTAYILNSFIQHPPACTRRTASGHPPRSHCAHNTRAVCRRRRLQHRPHLHQHHHPSLLAASLRQEMHVRAVYFLGPSDSLVDVSAFAFEYAADLVGANT
jgi:hypothetical protein